MQPRGRGSDGGGSRCPELRESGIAKDVAHPEKLTGCFEPQFPSYQMGHTSCTCLIQGEDSMRYGYVRNMPSS